MAPRQSGWAFRYCPFCLPRRPLLSLPFLILGIVVAVPGASAVKRGAIPRLDADDPQVATASGTVSPAELEDAEEADGEPGPLASLPEAASELPTALAVAPAPVPSREVTPEEANREASTARASAIQLSYTSPSFRRQHFRSREATHGPAPSQQEPHGPAPAPAEDKPLRSTSAPTPAPYPALAGAGVLLEVKVTHLDYDELVVHAALVDSFKHMMQEALAIQAGGGVLADDVSVTLYRGSVVVDAFVSLGHVNESVADQVVSQLGDDGLAGNVAAAVSDVDGISAISTGVLGVEVTLLAHRVGERQRQKQSESPVAAPAAAPAAAPGASPAAAQSADAGSEHHEGEVCYPHCVEGRGICVEGVCYCRAPYHGMRCHMELGATLRVDMTIACLLVIVTLGLGAFAGCTCFSVYTDRRKEAQFEEEEIEASENETGDKGEPVAKPQVSRSEVWRPSG